jgi:glyceraldehyde 3-phosphate dehydrogenase
MNNIRVAINGFGRIGRTLFRVLHQREGVEVVAFNDIADIHSLAHLLKYDSVHRTFDAQVSFDSNSLIVDGRKIEYTQESKLENLAWKNCDVVIEASGKYLSKDDLEQHILAGAKKVILAAPSDGDEVKMVVLGVNDEFLNSNDTLFSNASCTTNSAAPMVQLIDQNFGVEQAYITTVHSYTKDQNLHDTPHKDLRRARAGALSIIPTTTGAAKALSKIFPHLEIGGCGMRVPVVNGSLTDMTFIVKKNCTIEEVNQVFLKASESSHKGYVAYTEDPIVSIDVVGNPASCLFDAQLTSVLGKMVKVVSWYDNEMGYSHRLADLIKKLS